MACPTNTGTPVTSDPTPVNLTAEDDETNITMVPIGVQGDVKCECLGMFFNKNQIASDDIPSTNMVIEKDVLDRTPQFFIGRFDVKTPARGKIVFEVTFDGKRVDGYGSNLPYIQSTGQYDTTLFRWPGSAKANAPGIHQIHVKCGIIVGIVESQLGLLTWGQVKGVSEANFTVNLLPNKLPRD